MKVPFCPILLTLDPLEAAQSLTYLARTAAPQPHLMNPSDLQK